MPPLSKHFSKVALYPSRLEVSPELSVASGSELSRVAFQRLCHIIQIKAVASTKHLKMFSESRVSILVIRGSVCYVKWTLQFRLLMR